MPHQASSYSKAYPFEHNLMLTTRQAQFLLDWSETRGSPINPLIRELIDQKIVELEAGDTPPCP